MVPRLSLQLCTGEWQVQQKHVEFFTRPHCVPTLTPSWALWACPELCLDSSVWRWLCQQAWPHPHTTQSPSLFFSASPFLPPLLCFLASRHNTLNDWWGEGKVKQLKMALWANWFGFSAPRRARGFVFLGHCFDRKWKISFPKHKDSELLVREQS